MPSCLLHGTQVFHIKVMLLHFPPLKLGLALAQYCGLTNQLMANYLTMACHFVKSILASMAICMVYFIMGSSVKSGRSESSLLISLAGIGVAHPFPTYGYPLPTSHTRQLALSRVLHLNYMTPPSGDVLQL